MKLFATFAAALLVSAAAYAEISLHGVIKNGDDSIFFLSNSETKASRWVKLGGEFDGYTVATYDAGRSILTLKNAQGDIEAKRPDAATNVGPANTRDIAELGDTELAALGFHRVKAGETGMKIARANGITVDALRVLNPDVAFHRLKVGQILIVEPIQPPRPRHRRANPPSARHRRHETPDTPAHPSGRRRLLDHQGAGGDLRAEISGDESRSRAERDPRVLP